MSDLDGEGLSDLRDSVRTEVAAGYSSPAEIVEHAVEWLSDDLAPELAAGAAQRLVERLVAEELEAHRLAQAGWPSVTDYDRLANAFVELNAAGIVARDHFTCCGNCGAAEIWDEVDAYGERARGYTFFHMQDTEHAVAGQGLYLSYGSTGRQESDALEVAGEVVEVLRRHGLGPSWNGRIQTRVFVPLDWKRRR